MRSSAAAEDLANASMAGQYETFLDIEGEEELLDAVRRCWASLDSPRIRAYLREHRIDPARVAMAVVVQRLVSADVAGVLFTANPNESQMGAGNNGTREMLVEASWGLGESVVSGRVQPDVLRLEQESGRVLAATIADKQVHLSAGAGEERPVEESRRRLPCLRGRDVHRLWQLGRRTAQHFGAPQDIEWAIRGDEIFLLQSPHHHAGRCRGPRRTVAHHAPASAPGTCRRARSMGDAQSRGNAPAPDNADLEHHRPFHVRRRRLRQLVPHGGFRPRPAVMTNGFLERIAGRIYMDAARASEMFFANFPFAYDIEEPQTQPRRLANSADPAAAPPPTARKSTAASPPSMINSPPSRQCDRAISATPFSPDIADYAAAGTKIDLRLLSATELVALWQQHEKKVLDTFGPQSLLSSLISSMALNELRTFLADFFWEEDVDALAQQISSGGISSRTIIADAELYEVAQGIRPLETWLADHGHRAPGEFDLANPRCSANNRKPPATWPPISPKAKAQWTATAAMPKRFSNASRHCVQSYPILTAGNWTAASNSCAVTSPSARMARII